MAGLRPWQEKLVRTCLTLPNKKIIVHAIPGAGKGSVPYLVFGCTSRSIVQAVCHVVPRLNLRMQSGTPSQWLLNYFNGARLSMPTIRAADNIVPFRRGANGYAICWDSIRSEPDLHKQEFDNFKYALIIDEPQMLPSDGATKRALTPLVDRCSVLIMMSGTFLRSDGTEVVYLPYKNTPEGDVIDYDREGWTTIRYSRREALQDEAILPVEFMLRDASGKFIKAGDTREFGSFAELQTEDDQRAGLYAVLVDKGWEIAEEMLAAWTEWKKVIKGAQALIIIHRQAVARRYLKLIKEKYPMADVRIAVSDEPGSDAVLRDFRSGKGEILITVGMAYVGFDAPRISHIALLTFIRQRAWIEQAFSRGVRVDDRYPYKKQRCVVFAPNDPLLSEIVAEIEAEQAAVVREAHPGPGTGGGGDREPTIVIDAELGSAQAHELNVVKLTPELTERYAHALTQHGLTGTPTQLFHTISTAFGADAMPFAPNAPIIGIAEQEKKLRDQLQTRCSRIDALRKVSFGTTNSEMLKHFNLSRTEMSLDQLAQAFTWLEQTYPFA